MLPTVHYNMGGIPTNYHGEVISPKVGALAVGKGMGPSPSWGRGCEAVRSYCKMGYQIPSHLHSTPRSPATPTRSCPA